MLLNTCKKLIFAILLAVIILNALSTVPYLMAIEKSNKSAQSSWPIFRGNSNLTGVAEGQLPAKLHLRWQFKTGDDIKSSPVIQNGLVYIGSDDGKVYALDLTNGKPKWTFPTEHAFEAPPLVIDQTVFIGALNGVLYALDAQSGQLKWQYQTESKITGSANWVDLGKDKQKYIVLGSYDNQLHCVDAQSGKLVWTFETDNFINGAAGVEGQQIAFGGCDGLLHLISGVTGKQITEIDVGSYVPGSIAITQNEAFLGHYGNMLVCIDLQRQKIRWQYENKNQNGAFFSSPAVSRDYVIIGSRDYSVHCVNRTNGQLNWSFRTLDEIDSSPVICGDKVVVCSTDGRIYLLDLKKGTEIWSYEIGSPITGSPAVLENMLIIGAEDGRVYAFGGK